MNPEELDPEPIIGIFDFADQLTVEADQYISISDLVHVLEELKEIGDDLSLPEASEEWEQIEFSQELKDKVINWIRDNL